jgi:hypothetical protein
MSLPIEKGGSSFRWLLAGLLLLAGCEGAAGSSTAPVAGVRGEDPGAAGGDTDVGSFSMSLTLAGGYRFGEVGYDVSGNGFHKTGAIPVAASTTVSAIVDGIPFGTGYLLRLTAQDADRKLAPCTGSASLDVTSPAVVPVSVHLTCHEARRVQAVPVPIPRSASLILAGLLLAIGTLAARRRAGAHRSPW